MTTCVVAVAFAALAVLAAREAHADEAQVSVGNVEDARAARGYATPPPGRDGPIAVDPCCGEPPDDPAYRHDPGVLYRAPVRLTLGPVGATTGRGLGVGLGVGADFGTGTVGFRLSGLWTRGESSDPTASSLGSGLAQYTGELTLDLHKRGPWHPIVAVGLGLAHVSRDGSSGDAGIGTGRLGLEYALAVEDADVRLGAGVLGALTGPADRELADLRGYAVLGATLTAGF